jgi:hypothetical protein
VFCKNAERQEQIIIWQQKKKSTSEKSKHEISAFRKNIKNKGKIIKTRL